MSYLIIAALGAGLVVALKKLRDQQRTARDLHQAVLDKQPFLREKKAGGESDDDWDRLRAAINELIAEAAHLREVRSGQLAQLEATLGSLQEAVLIVDASNYVLLANQALQAIFPRAQNILDQRLERVLHSVAFLGYVEAVRTGRARPQHEIEFVEGSVSVWLEVTGTLVPPLNDRPGPWAIFVLHDITKQRKLEGVRKDFVANVSHELRTPLSIIKGYIETLVDGHRAMPLDDRERFLQTIQRHTERLNSLLDDLLALSRLESGDSGLHREPTRLADLIAGLVHDFRVRAAATGHGISAAIDPGLDPLLADPLKITQVLENLLDNALKHTPPGSRIEVSARPVGSDIEVCVRDNGPGIPAADLPRIFERFYRVDKGRSREKGGTGLGLSIVKHIVQLHGGRVWAESEAGKGTAFHFALPLRAGM